MGIAEWFGLTKASGSSVPNDRAGAWRQIVREPFTGAWQQNAEIKTETVLTFHAVFACQTLIASDIAKLRMKLVRKDEHGIWSETTNPAYSPVLRKPNSYQNRIQFFESWVLSKLRSGNTYVLKQRDGRGVVTGLFVLAPELVTPLVSESGEVFYQLKTDRLSGLSDEIVVPAREIIHDRFNCLFHPLVGLSPIYANGLAATQGISIQNNSNNFFANGSQPGGILTAPGAIADETAARLKAYWDANYTGSNRGKVAVLGDGLRFEALAIKAVDAQLIDQLRWTAEVVCSTYHVPPYKIGVGAQPSYNNVQALNVEYYSQCLQILMEGIELCLDEGLATGDALGTEFDVDNLLRMDSVTAFEVADKAKGVLTLDERRKRVDAAPIKGGATVYLQQQDHSLAAIAARDALLIAQAEAPAVPVETPANDNAETEAARAVAALVKGLA